MEQKSFWKALILLTLAAILWVSAKTLVTGNDVAKDVIDVTEDKTIVTVNETSIAIPNNWYNRITVNPEGNFYLTDWTLFALFHAETCAKDGRGWIFSICRYKADEYEEMYLQSESRQYVFARDELSYYCVLLPSDIQSEDQSVNEFMEGVRTDEIKKLLDDMVSRNGLSEYSEGQENIVEE